MAGAHVRRRRRAGRGFGLYRRQRPVLPQHRHGDRQGHDRSGAQHRARLDRHGHVSQRHRVRHSRQRHRRSVVHGAGGNAGRALFPRLLGRRRQSRHGGFGHCREHRPWRLCHGGGAGGGGLRRRRFGGRGRRLHANDARNYRQRNPHWAIPALNFAGVATGIDVRLVVETGIAPTINTGIAHKQPGVGQVGAGVVRAPLACFSAAVAALGAGPEAT